MFDFMTKNVFFVTLGVVIGSEVVWKLVQKFLLNSDNMLEVNEVLFFPDDIRSLDQSKKGMHISHVTQTTKSSSLSRLLMIVSGCKKSIDLCLFLITLKDMSSLVIRLMKDGVAVRLLVDKSNIGIAGCQVNRLRAAGVRVVARSQAGLMHHKFAVLDGRMLVTGSFNWTSQAVMSNNENVVVTTNQKLVEPFVVEFEKLWQQNMQEMEAMMFKGDW